MTDYTDTQTESITKVHGAAHVSESAAVSQQAEFAYRRIWGSRGRYVHVKATTMLTGPFHFSDKWAQFVRFKHNITVFFVNTTPVGWLFNNEIAKRWVSCPLGVGFDMPLAGLRDIKDFDPKEAS